MDPLSIRVAAKFAARHATEFPSQEALKEYMHEHPDADPANHSVKKPGDDKKEPESKGDKGKDDDKKSEKKLYDRAGDLKPKAENVFKALQKGMQEFANPYRKDGERKSDEDKKAEAHELFKTIAPDLRSSLDEGEKILEAIPEDKRDKFYERVKNDLKYTRQAVENVESFAKDPAKAAKESKNTWAGSETENIRGHAKYDIADAHKMVSNFITDLRIMAEDKPPPKKEAPPAPKKEEKKEPPKEESKSKEKSEDKPKDEKKPWYKKLFGGGVIVT